MKATIATLIFLFIVTTVFAQEPRVFTDSDLMKYESSQNEETEQQLDRDIISEEKQKTTEEDLIRYRSESDNDTYISNKNLSEDKSQSDQESIQASNDAKLEEHCHQSLRDNYKEFKYLSGLEAYTMLLSSCRDTKDFSVWCDKTLGQIEHPIKLAATEEAYANLLNVCHGSGEVRSSHRRQTPTDNGAKNQFNKSNINKGAINTRTGEHYPGAAGGIINPKTGQFYPDVGGGYINPKTGEFMPKQ